MREDGPSPRLQDRLENTKPIDAVERMVLGSCIITPYLLDRCASLSAGDFRAPLRGQILDVMRGMPRSALEAWSLVLALDDAGLKPPQGLYGWAPVVSTLLDDVAIEEEAFDFYVRAVSAAAIARKIEDRAR